MSSPKLLKAVHNPKSTVQIKTEFRFGNLAYLQRKHWSIAPDANCRSGYRILQLPFCHTNAPVKIPPAFMDRCWMVQLLFWKYWSFWRLCVCVYQHACCKQLWAAMLLLREEYLWISLLFVIYSVQPEYWEILRGLAFLTELKPYEIPIYKNDWVMKRV